jgi:carbon monoxide dehydrogenase subunit G
MAVIAETIDLPAPPSEVWAKIADLEEWPNWLTIHTGFPDGTPSLSEGTQFKQKVKIMGMPGEVAWTVAACDEADKLELQGKGPMGTTMRTLYDLQQADGGTRVAYEAEFGGAALAAMAGPLEKESRKGANESLEKLRALLA